MTNGHNKKHLQEIPPRQIVARHYVTFSDAALITTIATSTHQYLHNKTGSHTLDAKKNHRNPLRIALLLALSPAAAFASTPITLETITVTGTKEPRPVAETTASVGVIESDKIDDLKPGHPSEIMGKVPGVHINVTGGEGHMAAIRQPITTSAVYLYLEDGIPTRSTGFFNHNALYEVNLPQSGGIEVTKGPGTALYGSDAIGGVINVTTRPAPLRPEAEATVEVGDHGWNRVLLTGGTTKGNDGIRADLNITHSDGWRDATEYDRQTATLRWDRFLENDAIVKTVLTTSNIDQQTAGTSRLSRDDYFNNPTKNKTPISFRKIKAVRLSSAYEKEDDNTLLSITPYARYNSTELLPNWSLTYDKQHYTTENHSLGLMTRYRMDFAPMRTRVIIGIDLDHSPGSRDENKLTTTKTGDIFTGYSEGDKTYLYDVDFTGIAPYTHVEFSPSDKLRIDAGLRFDYIAYDYNNQLTTLTTGKHRRPESTTVEFHHVSPKLGASYAFSNNLNGYASYRNTFRAPGQSQLFRQGQAVNTVDLKPIEADNFEVGLRGDFGRYRYEASLYHLKKENDILSFRNTVTGDRETQNAGETQHRGIEVGFGSKITDTLQLDISHSYAEHTYEQWSPKTGVNYSGNEIKSAPRNISDVRLNWHAKALNGGRIELNWEHLGRYWLDDENSHQYEGHDLIHLRANYYLNKQLEVFGRIHNLSDKRYATGASFSQFNGEEFAPGLPRTLYAGVSYKWQ